MQKATLEEHDPAANEWDNTKPSEHIIQSAIYVHQMTVRIWVVDLIWICQECPTRNLRHFYRELSTT